MKLCIYGMGGFGKEVFDIASRINKKDSCWDDVFFMVDDPNTHAETYKAKLYSVKHVFKECDLDELEVIVAVGEPKVRKILFDKVRKKGVKMATLIDPSAIISDAAIIKQGVIVAPLSIVTSSTVVGQNSVINTHSTVGHDIIIGDHSVLSSHVTVGGSSVVGERSYIGLGSQIKEQTRIGDRVIIGMGSVVYSDIPDCVIALGNPARVSRKNDDDLVFK